MSENKCLECLDPIFRKIVGVWTLRGHQGRMISESLTSWVIVGPKFTTTARAIYGETM